MKSFVKILCVLSILGIATVACNKEVETETPVASKHSVKVTAGISAGTRTEMLPSGDETKWTAGDVDNIHFFENGIAPDPETFTVDLNQEKTVMTLTAEFSTPADKYVYTSILASDLDVDKNATLGDEQVFPNGTFDPNADILVAKPEEFPANQNDIAFSMQYKRVVAVNKIKIKGLVEDDIVESVTINSNKPILGSYSMTNDKWTNSGYELTLYPYNGLEVPSEGEVSIYFITAPVEQALLSIYVETDNHNYEKDFTKPITFAANTVTSFATTVAGSEIEEHEGTGNYVRVESTDDLTTGQYLLVSEYTGRVFTGISTTSTKYGIEAPVTITDHSITPQNLSTSGAQVLELVDATTTSGAYAFKFDNKYLTWTSGNSLNTAPSESANTNWTITIASGNATIANVADGSRIILRNCANPRFACYAGQTPKDDDSGYDFVQLYKLDVGGSTKTPLVKPIISLARNSTLDGIVVTWNDVSKAANYTVTCTDQTDQTIAQGVQTAEFANLTPGTYTVTVTANPANAERNTATTSDAASLEILDYHLAAPTLTFTAALNCITVSWTTVPNAASYTYTVLGPDNAVVIAETNTEDLTFTASNLAENTTYTFKVKSIGAAPYISSDFTTKTQKTLSSSPTVVFVAYTDVPQGTSTNTITKDGITITMSTMNEEVYKTYKGSNMVVSAEAGKKIVCITLTCTNAGQEKYGPGCFSLPNTQPGAYSYEGKIGTWTGEAQSVSLGASLNQVRMTKIEVNYSSTE